MSIFCYEEGALSERYEYLKELGKEAQNRVALYAKKQHSTAKCVSSSKGDHRQRAMFAIKEFPISRFHREYLWSPAQLKSCLDTPRSNWFQDHHHINRSFWHTLTEITALYEMRDVPNVAHLEEVIVSVDNVYLVMTHDLEARSLKKYLISRKALLEEWQIRSIMIQILEAV